MNQHRRLQILQDRIAHAEKRAIPTRKDLFFLYLVWWLRGTWDDSKLVPGVLLRFLQKHLSSKMFADVTYTLSPAYKTLYGVTDAVTWLDIRMVMQRRKQLDRLLTEKRSLEHEVETKKLQEKTLSHG